MSGIKLEIAVFTPQSALTAYRAGADRIELCSGYGEGGLSPAASTIKMVRKNVDCKIHVMIRPRIGDFIYTNFEKDIIIEEIKYCKANSIDGIVFGALTPQGEIDTDFVNRVVETAYPMSITFHRAFDLMTEHSKALQTLIDCKVDRILTSGGKKSVPDGIETISQLIKEADNKIVILPGGGITTNNVTDILKTTYAKEIHFSGKQLVKSTMSRQADIKLSSDTETDEYKWFESNYLTIKTMRKILDSLK